MHDLRSLTSSVERRRRLPRARPRPLSRVALLGVLLAAAPAAAVDPVPGFGVSRSGNDLVLSWSAPPTPVDGYRVYKALDRTCSNVTLVYQGPALAWADSGAFLDPAAALYAVAAYAGPDEGPRSVPAYKYPVEVAPPLPGTAGGRLVSPPWDPGPADAEALCVDLNGRSQSTAVLTQVARSRPDTGTIQVKFCLNSIRIFQLPSGEAYRLLVTAPTPQTMLLWGTGGSPGEILFGSVYVPPPTPESCPGGMHFVALPWDHAYADLAEIAAEVPGAVRVAVYNPDVTGTDPCLATWIGLERASAGDPWTGTNVPLADRPGEGVAIAVEAAPAAWTPRRLCTAFGPGQPLNLAPVADAGGPYDSTLCRGGLIGIWLDGSASLDPDASGPLAYAWSSTCTGTIDEPSAAITTALFDCDPCASLDCEVRLAVTDPLGASDEDTAPVFSRQVASCVAPGNNLRLARRDGRIQFDWGGAPPAQSYLLLGDEERAIGSPSQVTCGPAREHLADAPADALRFFGVTSFDESCAPR